MTTNSKNVNTAVKKYRAALIGNPNTGKTTLLNSLCGTRQKTGNYPGVTIEKKVGYIKTNDSLVEIVDLPGLYSLNALTPDEKIAENFLLGHIDGEEKIDVIIIVMDALNLRRNLFLYSQAAEIGIPMLVVLTMKDMLEENGLQLDEQLLSERLNAPVFSLDARSAPAARELRTGLFKILHDKDRPISIPNIPYPKPWKELITEARERFDLIPCEVEEVFFEPEDMEPYLKKEAVEWLRKEKSKASFQPFQITRARYQWAEKITNEVLTRIAPAPRDLTKKIDDILTHRVYGLGIFVTVMYLMFRAIYSWSQPVMDLISAGFDRLSEAISPLAQSSPMLESMLTDGVITGVGSVVVFLPQIIILFLFVAALEDSGYLARAAFMMDKLLGWTGLNGRSFIPLLSSFACAVPGILSARVMPDRKTRMATVLVAPLMSCSARLPVYILFIGAFIQPHYGAGVAALTLFLMHGVGPLLSLPVARILNKNILRTPSQPFVLEMPPYRRPAFRSIVYRVYDAAKKFLVRAGTVIFAMTILIWALTYFPRDEKAESKIREQISLSQNGTTLTEAQKNALIEQQVSAYHLEHSYLGKAGRWVQPIFAPLGFDWKLSVGILSAFPARETIIATLGIIYRVGDDVDETSTTLREKLTRETKPDGTPLYTPLVAISLMLFFALSSQCMSTLATVMKELGSVRWAVFLFTYMTVLAYLVSLTFYQIGRLL